MESFTLGWAVEKLGANLPEGAAERVVRGICTDTRNDAQDTLFFALKGETSDGHQYVEKAFEKGAMAAIVSEVQSNIDGIQIVVPDTVIALGDLAQAYRLQFDIPVVGITGSVGKTSTKEMTAAVLRTKYNVLANEKNYNNEIGVPLTLFRLEKSHEVAVIEMGMRGLGEIDRLAEIAAPTIGVITNIGYAHIERLGSQEKIAEAKSELLARLPSDGVAILPAEDKFLVYLVSRVTKGAEVKFAGSSLTPDPSPLFPPSSGGEGRTIPNHEVPTLPELVRERGLGGEGAVFLQIPAVGSHHIYNAILAITVGSVLGISLRDSMNALANWHGAEGRMNAIRLPDGTTVLDDCYNAGVESMTAALRTLREHNGDRKIAVLGDMKELGNFSSEAHRMIGREVIKNQVDRLITVGDLAKEIGKEAVRSGNSAPKWLHTNNAEEAAAAFHNIPLKNATVLVKGSRAMRLERVVAAITGQESDNAHA